jgi:hypothetical protein
MNGTLVLIGTEMGIEPTTRAISCGPFIHKCPLTICYVQVALRGGPIVRK